SICVALPALLHLSPDPGYWASLLISGTQPLFLAYAVLAAVTLIGNRYYSTAVFAAAAIFMGSELATTSTPQSEQKATSTLWRLKVVQINAGEIDDFSAAMLWFRDIDPDIVFVVQGQPSMFKDSGIEELLPYGYGH
ncbi:unnamed protein product, partial [Discosporangium mesarthrocarpum]